MSRANDIAEVTEHLKSADQVCFIVGAGASKAAGVPLAAEFIRMIGDKYGYLLNGLSEEERGSYGKVMSLLSPADRVKLIRPFLEDSAISWGQIALAAIMRMAIEEKRAARILTFNFDLVLEDAAALLGLRLPVYDFGAGLSGDTSRIARHAILHLHGQSFGFVLLNTEAETTRHRELLRPVLREAVREGLTIVTGYSGEADGAFDVIREEYDSYNRLIWLGYSETPKRHLTPLVGQGYFKYIGGCDFDRTMIALAKQLGIWPPAIISNPMQHLLEQLSAVKEYPVDHASETDVLASTRERLGQFSDRWVSEHTVRDKAAALVVGGGADGPASIETLEGEELSDDTRTNLAWAAIVAGNALADEALTLSGPAAAERFAESYGKYAQALEIKPDMHEALNNWGVALLDEALRLYGPAASERFAASYDKFERALGIDPDLHETLNNWGNALFNEGKTLSGGAAMERFAASYDKFARSLQIEPNDSRALHGWGAALANEAVALSGSAAAERFADSYKKFARALEIKSDNHEVLRDWAAALSSEARSLAETAVAEQFEASNAKFAQALEIKPDDPQTLDAWAGGLLLQALTLPDKEATEMRARAQEMVEKARSMSGKASYNLACLLAINGRQQEALEELERCRAEGVLPSRAHLDGDRDLDALRGLPAFQALLDGLDAKLEPAAPA